MKRSIFTGVATLSLILPLGVSGAMANPTDDAFTKFTPATQQIAQHHSPGGKRMGRGEGMSKMLEQLNLTPEQSEQIETIKTESRDQNDALHQDMETIREEMRSLLASDASVEQLRQQHQRMQELHQKLSDNRFETMLQIREVLTPEQRSQMADLMSEKRTRRGDF